MNIRTTQSDIDFERERSAAEDSTAGIPVRKYSDGYLETLAIYRKIADQMLDYDTILFHGSCVSVDGEGYLFTAKSGTGLRSLLDRHVYLSKKREILDFDYIEKECEILGIADFEKESRSLCMKVFGSIDLPVLCESECEMLEYYMFSTTYGTQKQGIQHRLEKKYGSTGTTAKFRYLFRRVFPKIEFYKKFCPFAYRRRILIPFVWIYRFVRALFVRRKHIKHEINAVNKIK